MFRWIPALCAAAFAASAIATENRHASEPVVTVIAPNSAGMPSCGAWTAARTTRLDGVAAQYEKWALGFESGLNLARSAARGDVLRGADTEGVLSWVDQFCREHPLDTLSVAVVDLDRELTLRHVAH